MTIDDAALKLGCPVGEIASVTDEPAGTVITMTDGSSYIDVPSEAPDFDGKTGLMYLELPHATYLGTFPVYATGPDQAIPAESADDGTDAGDDQGEGDSQAPADAAPVPVRGKPAKAS